MNYKKHTVIVFRHGYAESYFGQSSDFERKLTEEGHALAQKAGEGLKTLIPQVDRILHSPLVRAKQTAEHIHKNYVDIPIISAGWLAQPNLNLFFQALLPYSGITLLVSHHPMVYDFSKMAISGPWVGKGFTPNAMCVFEFDEEPRPKVASFISYYSGEDLANLIS